MTEISRYACPLVSLQYSVLDPDTLKRLHRSKKQQIEMEKLANKVILHKILFVDFGTTRKYSMNIIIGRIYVKMEISQSQSLKYV